MLDDLLARRVVQQVEFALRTFRGVVVGGVRQSGKTTLVRQLLETDATYLSLDDASVRTAAHTDPHGLVATTEPMVIDEFQRGGDDLLLAVKQRLDTSNDRGQILLSGSSNFLASRHLSETLAGRIGIVTVMPLSQGEIDGVREGFLERVLDGVAALRKGATTAEEPDLVAGRIARGGFPEVVTTVPAEGRPDWFQSFVQTVVERETPAVARLGDTSGLRRTLNALATSTGQQVNMTQMASRLSLSRPTVQAYLDLLEAVYLLDRVPAWSPEAPGRLTKGPKIHLVDSGLATALLGWSASRLADPTWTAAGAVWESFVVSELRKQSSWLRPQPSVFHARDKGGRHEVDAVVEWPDGALVGIEVKRARSVRTGDADGLRWLQTRSRGRMRAGVLLYGGTQTHSLGDDLLAMPISALWA